jgi:hypothetical protein
MCLSKGHSWESFGVCVALQSISLPRAANDSLLARIFGGRMTQSGRGTQRLLQTGLWIPVL